MMNEIPGDLKDLNEAKPLYKTRHMLDDFGNLHSSSSSIYVVITYEDVKGDEFESVVSVSADVDIDEFVSLYMQSIPFVVWHSWRIADDNDLDNGTGYLFTMGPSAANMSGDYDGDLIEIMPKIVKG